MSRAVLSLGSNLGEPVAQLRAALAELGPDVVAVSSFYRTPPWGPVEQGDFLNCTVLVDAADTDAAGWLAACHRVERAALRERRVRWGPRTLDADVIAVWVDGLPVRSDDPELTLPHPRAAERAFVLLPWAEIEPNAELPGHGPIRELLSALDTADIQLVAAEG